jgi:hypothetical protein
MYRPNMSMYLYFNVVNPFSPSLSLSPTLAPISNAAKSSAANVSPLQDLSARFIKGEISSRSMSGAGQARAKRLWLRQTFGARATMCRSSQSSAWSWKSLLRCCSSAISLMVCSVSVDSCRGCTTRPDNVRAASAFEAFVLKKGFTNVRVSVTS